MYRHAPIGDVFLCSMSCLLAACDERPVYVGRKLSVCRWNVLHEALWIEANAAKLRAAGEIR
jgi:hypothetical protein